MNVFFVAGWSCVLYDFSSQLPVNMGNTIHTVESALVKLMFLPQLPLLGIAPGRLSDIFILPFSDNCSSVVLPSYSLLFSAR